MKDILVKDVMIPISDYVKVKKEDRLVDVLNAIEGARVADQGHAHRDAIVVDENDRFVGNVAMLDIFRALDPGYRKIRKDRKEKTLTNDFVNRAVKELNLWMEPVEDVCHRSSRVTVAEAMHIPEKSEFINEEDTLGKGLSLYVMGVHQPLIVKKGDTVTGVLRFGDIFEVLHKHLLTCNLA